MTRGMPAMTKKKRREIEATEKRRNKATRTARNAWRASNSSKPKKEPTS